MRDKIIVFVTPGESVRRANVEILAVFFVFFQVVIKILERNLFLFRNRAVNFIYIVVNQFIVCCDTVRNINLTANGSSLVFTAKRFKLLNEFFGFLFREEPR